MQVVCLEGRCDGDDERNRNEKESKKEKGEQGNIVRTEAAEYRFAENQALFNRNKTKPIYLT